eukprot:gb/GECG01013604.1/.p1 GENE.gb/GECG01013604.1/~~gb/GECG01013604.1/.p1  ORF type:complete len:159 (+),score=16.43 gb/GECG01013604.1/:1-477(+)
MGQGIAGKCEKQTRPRSSYTRRLCGGIILLLFLMLISQGASKITDTREADHVTKTHRPSPTDTSQQLRQATEQKRRRAEAIRESLKAKRRHRSASTPTQTEGETLKVSNTPDPTGTSQTHVEESPRKDTPLSKSSSSPEARAPGKVGTEARSKKRRCK